MRIKMNEADRRISITCKKAIVEEAKAKGFDKIDGYIQYLKARITDLEAQLNNPQEEVKKEPIVIPTPKEEANKEG